MVHYLNFSLPLLLVLFLYELSSSFNKGFHFYPHNIQYVFVWRILLKCLYNQIFANNFLKDNLSSTEKNLIFRNVQMWVTSKFCLYHPLFLLAPPAIQENELVSPSNSQIALYIPPWQPKSDNIRFRTLMYSILHFQGVQSVTVLTCPPVILLPLLDTSYFLFLCWPVHWVNLSWCGASPGFVALKWPSRLVWLSRVTHFSRRSFHQLLLTQIISSLLSTY